jgi:hypothetical protein
MGDFSTGSLVKSLVDDVGIDEDEDDKVGAGAEVFEENMDVEEFAVNFP